MTLFENALYQLDYWGLSDIILPFILVFTIAFAILQKAKIFGEEKRFNVIVALVLGLAVVLPHSLGTYPYGTDVVEIINAALPGVSLVMVMAVMFLLLIGVLGGEPNWTGGAVGGIIGIVATILIIIIFGSAAGWWEMTGFLYWLDNPDTQATILIVGIFLLIGILAFAPEKKTPGETMLGKFGDMFKGK